MAIGSGLAAQIGIANETVVNTPVAVTNFNEFDSETLDLRPNFAQGVGLRAGGLVPREARRVLTSADGGGQVVMDVTVKNFGKWVQAMMGSYATTATQILSTTAWQQIHNLGSADGKTFTLQKGIPEVGGTVDPLTFGGCKLNAWQLDAQPNAICKFTGDVDAMSVQPTGAGALGLQTASYTATNALFAFNQLTVQTFTAYTVASGIWTPTTPANIGVVRKVTLKGGQPKDLTRWQAGSQTKAEQLVNNFQPITGTIDIDYASTALYTQFAANTSTGLVFKWTGADQGGGNLATLQLVHPAVNWEQGSTPKVSGPGIATVSYPFTALDDGVNGALQILIVSSDTTV